jgi:hypothetical protein
MEHGAWGSERRASERMEREKMMEPGKTRMKGKTGTNGIRNWGANTRQRFGVYFSYDLCQKNLHITTIYNYVNIRKSIK